MCGIGGILRFDGQPVERDRLLRMQESLACRGPDDCVILINGRLGFVHTRLAILDIPGGNQPMRLPDRNLTVIFNGEIYNHRELRRELETRGHAFTSDHSDTEVLLHGYREWAEELPGKLRGMFAFAIWDGEGLFLARDHAGKKPLFYWSDQREFIFSSTVAAVRLAISGKTELNPDALHQFLSRGYTVGPTVFRGIQELGPSQMLRVQEPREKYFSLPHRRNAGPAPGSSDRGRFKELITNAVQTRLQADVPLGCFLSGGLDSSLIAAIAQQQLQSRGGRLQTFSVAMPEASYDESRWARRVAQHIGSQHHELRAEPNVEANLQTLIASMGEPFADSSILPSYWLSKAAKQHVKVALSGDGGDELFGGYDRYVAIRLLQRHANRLRMIPVALLGGEQKSRRARLRRLVEAARIPGTPQRYEALTEIFSHRQIDDLGLTRDAPGEAGGAPGYVSDMWESKDDPAESARLWDFRFYLPGDLLRKVDRASMAVGLEVRCPLLDRAVCEAALATPMSTLMPGRRTKAMLREIARPFLPADVVARRKMGFAVPIGQWFKDSLRPMVQRWLLDEPYLGSIGLKREVIEQFLREHLAGEIDHTHRIFALLSLSMWIHWRDEAGS